MANGNYAASDFVPNGYGLVPVEMVISEAGLGLRAGEVRGVAPDIAAHMCNLGSAKPLELSKKAAEAVAAQVAADIAASQAAADAKMGTATNTTIDPNAI